MRRSVTCAGTRAAREKTVYYVFVVDSEERLHGVWPRSAICLVAPGDKLVRDVMRKEVISAPEDLDQEALSKLFMRHHLLMMPIVDAAGRIRAWLPERYRRRGSEEATEDMQKLGGVEALEEPYLEVPLPRMIRKRAGWLAALFFGEMLTATAMGHLKPRSRSAVVLGALRAIDYQQRRQFRSQATTLVIRAMALGEIRLRDWWRVIRARNVHRPGAWVDFATIGLIRILFLAGSFPGLWGTLFSGGPDSRAEFSRCGVVGLSGGFDSAFYFRGLDSIPRARLRPLWRRWSTSPDW